MGSSFWTIGQTERPPVGARYIVPYRYRRIAQRCLRRIPDHFPDVELGAYVVMPNPVHRIIIMDDWADGTSARRGTIYRALSPSTQRALLSVWEIEGMPMA
jgi:hypothetical protein